MSLSIYLTCPCCKTDVYESGITNNLTTMAAEADLYVPLWRPEEANLTIARQFIKPLKKGIRKLKADPEFFKAYNSPNGWGVYKDLFSFVKNYWKACVKNPNAVVSAWRQ